MILLINIDSKIPNLALHKIEKFYKDKGEKVMWNFPLLKGNADKIYVSCIFSENKKHAERWRNIAEVGGSGYDLGKKLPEEIERIKPKINWGFTTRGCIRNCEWCIVPEKEGKIHIVGDIYDIWDGKSEKIYLMDNNILALQKHFKKICKQVRKEKLKADFNQGLDIRFLNEEIAYELSITNIIQNRFSYDFPEMKSVIEEKMPLLKKYNIRAMWYILVGFNSCIEEEIGRVNYLISQNQRPYIMRHKKANKDPRYIAISGWANNPKFGKGTTPFKDFLKTKWGSKYKKYFKNR